MAKGADKKVSGVVGIQIHHSVCMLSASNNETFFITQRWYAAERARDIIAF
jgi:hypothetical protein